MYSMSLQNLMLIVSCTFGEHVDQRISNYCIIGYKAFLPSYDLAQSVQYCMIYRGPGYISCGLIIWLRPFSLQQIVSLSQSSFVSPLDLPDESRGKGG